MRPFGESRGCRGARPCALTAPLMLALLVASVARADIPRIDETALTIGGKKFAIGVPAGWRCQSHADGEAARIEVLGPAGEALVVMTQPAAAYWAREIRELQAAI